MKQICLFFLFIILCVAAALETTAVTPSGLEHPASHNILLNNYEHWVKRQKYGMSESLNFTAYLDFWPWNLGHNGLIWPISYFSIQNQL